MVDGSSEEGVVTVEPNPELFLFERSEPQDGYVTITLRVQNAAHTASLRATGEDARHRIVMFHFATVCGLLEALGSEELAGALESMAGLYYQAFVAPTQTGEPSHAEHDPPVPG
jgi:hypothetical protein